MRSARYEFLKDRTFYGEIPELRGVYANGGSLEECRSELQSALEDWIVFSLRKGFDMPALDRLIL
jgi:predicted RNase H-like HicB family nuclease